MGENNRQEWRRVIAGHYIHDETGIEIRLVAYHRWAISEPATAPGLIRPAVITSRSLTTAMNQAAIAGGLISMWRQVIAKAHDEAHVMDVERNTVADRATDHRYLGPQTEGWTATNTGVRVHDETGIKAWRNDGQTWRMSIPNRENVATYPGGFSSFAVLRESRQFADLLALARERMAEAWDIAHEVSRDRGGMRPELGGFKIGDTVTWRSGTVAEAGSWKITGLWRISNKDAVAALCHVDDPDRVSAARLAELLHALPKPAPLQPPAADARDRLIRRAQYDALKVVRQRLEYWEQKWSGDLSPRGVRRVLADAANILGTDDPCRDAS